MASTGEQPSTTSARREMMFCHECQDEWFRDMYGIICPECGSEFTEIIEEGNDPRDNAMHGSEHDEDNDSLPSLEDRSHNTHPLHDHNPWHDDPDEADISTMRFQPMGPGRFHVSATIHRTISPAAFGQNGNGPNTIGGITSFLANILQGAQNQQRGTSTQSEGQQQGGGEEGQGNARSGPTPDGQAHVHRFTYSAGARLHPRDDNNPPRLEPMDDINNVLSGLFAAFGPPGPPPGPRAGGQDHDHDNPFAEMPMNPLMGLLAAMSGGQHGDFVYSQEALDRIVSQLMEQTASSNAPGPAPQEAIDALPRREVTEKMLGVEGRAECSICMDEVNIGEEVTELPCKHWFHHPCVSAWLHEHDTCPHCRKSIAPHDDNTRASGPGANSTSTRADPTMNMPGAFGATGDGTPEHPFIIPGPSNANPSSNATQAQGGADNGTNGSNGGERFRSGWSGPQQ